MALSVIVPVLDEAAAIEVLTATTLETLEAMACLFEILFVDDGSTDQTPMLIAEIQRRDQRVRLIRMARHSGKSAALAAGVRHSRGRTLVTMDGDLQDDPAEIPKLVARHAQGVDLVCGWRRQRSDNLGRRLSSRAFNWAVGRLSNLDLHDMNCGLKAGRREVFEAVPLQSGSHRYVPLLAIRQGFCVAEVAVNHRPRLHGRSHYGWSRAITAPIDLLALLMVERHERSVATVSLREGLE